MMLNTQFQTSECYATNGKLFTFAAVITVKAALTLSLGTIALLMCTLVSSTSSPVFTLFIAIVCFVFSSSNDHSSYRLNGDFDNKFSKQVYSKDKDRRQQRIEEKQKLVIKKLLSKPRRTIDELCSELDRTCFTITDAIFKHDNTISAFRSLRRKGPQGVLTLSQARLQPHLPLNWENFNSKTWFVKKDYVRLTYARLMIAGAFLSGGLEYNITKKQDILIIGLGGGVINNYFTQMENQVLNATIVDIDPVMLKVAKKWFAFAESPLHRIVIDDGVRYIHDAVRRGEKYNVLIIDLCYNIPLPMMCPIKEFLEDDLIASMKAITADNGAVIVNLIVDDSEEALKALPPYSRHFPSCYFMNYSKEKMLFCSAKKNNSYLNTTDYSFRDRFMTVDIALGFRLFPNVYPSLD